MLRISMKYTQGVISSMPPLRSWTKLLEIQLAIQLPIDTRNAVATVILDHWAGESSPGIELAGYAASSRARRPCRQDKLLAAMDRS